MCVNVHNIPVRVLCYVQFILCIYAFVTNSVESVDTVWWTDRRASLTGQNKDGLTVLSVNRYEYILNVDGAVSPENLQYVAVAMYKNGTFVTKVLYK